MIKKKTSKFRKYIEKSRAVLFGAKRKRLPMTFEIHIADGCNLNCKGCYHFSPLAPKDAIYDLDEFRRDLARMYELFGANIGWVHLLGGEPLLNNNVIDYMRVARECLGNAEISIITNGIRLMNMSDEFFESVKKYNILIDITRYPIAIDYDKVEEYALSKGCRVRIFGDKGGDFGMRNASLDKNNTRSAKYNFLRCRTGGICNSLHHGKIYYCSIPAYVCFFNEYFGENYDASQDGIDIYTHTTREVVDFLRKPHNFCKYCNLEYKKSHKVKWDFSAKDKGEWTVPCDAKPNAD